MIQNPRKNPNRHKKTMGDAKLPDISDPGPKCPTDPSPKYSDTLDPHFWVRSVQGPQCRGSEVHSGSQLET